MPAVTHDHIAVDYVDPSTLNPAPYNPRVWDELELAALMASIAEFGFVDPVVVNRPGRVVVGGHMRLEAVRRMDGHDAVPVVWVDVDDVTERRLNLALNRTGGRFDPTRLEAMLRGLADERDDWLATGFRRDDIDRILSTGSDRTESARRSLAETFGAPPFTTLDARQGYWRSRKRHWRDYGAESRQGRDADVKFLHDPGAADPAYYQKKKALEAEFGRTLTKAEFDEFYVDVPGQAISSFDPALTELVYRWFAPPAARILDPYAGGPTRGLVAAVAGHTYHGIDLLADQVDTNRAVAESLALDPNPTWILGDATHLATHLPDTAPYDLVFTCPPYGPLEKYSDDPADLSNMSHDDFVDAYTATIAQAVERLAPDRFAVYVTAPYKDGKHYRYLPGITVAAFTAAGATLHNDAILIDPIGSAPVRAPHSFKATRYLVRTHQNVQVFVKGDPSAAATACAPLD